MKALFAAVGSFLIIFMIGRPISARAQQQHDMPGMKASAAQPAKSQDSASDSPRAPQDNSADNPMDHKHMDMGPHMYMTSARPQKPGDKQRAEEVLQAARKVMDQYRDYKVALKNGFKIFLPDVPQKMYHFTNTEYALEARSAFNLEHPASLLYEKQAGDYKLLGIMYTAPVQMSEDGVDQRVPLSIAQWHKHVNVCLPPPGKRDQALGTNRRFGFHGSIAAQDECEKEGGKFYPVIFGWMVHLYPDGKTPEEIWSVERQQDDHMERTHE